MYAEIFECISNPDTYRFEIKWKVHKEVFQNLEIKNGKHNSSVFQTKFHNSRWFLKLETTSENPEYFGFYLCLEKADVDSLKFRFTACLESERSWQTSWASFTETPSLGYRSLGSTKWKNKEQLMKDSNWSTDYVTFIVHTNVTHIIEKSVNERPIGLNQSDISTLTENYSSLAQSGLYYDVTLTVGGKEYKAHKAILATRCEYFSALFSSSFKEAVESKVTIIDIEPDDFDYILQFIYSGQHSKDPKSKTTGLLMAADRLGFLPIVLECEEYLSKNITVENCLDLFHVADLCSRDNFKSTVKMFMKNNMKAILQTDSWRQMKQENNILLTNVVESLFQK